MVNAIKYNEILKRKGYTLEQSSGLIEVMSDMVEQNFLSKTDLEIETTKIRSEMRVMGAEIRAEMKEMGVEIRSEMKRLDDKIESQADKIVIRLGAMIVGFSAVIGGLVVYFK